jgi:hypothetical protein
MGIEALLSTQIIDTTTVGRAVMTAADAAAARTALGLGTLATQNGTITDYLTTAAAATTYQPLDGNLTALAALTGTNNIYYRSAANTWSSVTIGTGLTFTGGTLAASGGSGISSLNGLTDATQTFQTGTSGTNVGWVSAAGVHTLNIPDASATARGLVTTGSQTFAGDKSFSGVIRPASNITFSTNGTGIGFNSGNTEWFQSASNILLFRIAGSERARIDGSFACNNAYGSGHLWYSGGTYWGFVADAVNIVSLRNATIAQTFRVTNTWTSTTAYEWLSIGWSANVCTITTEKGSAGGTLRGLRIGDSATALLGFYGATAIVQPGTGVASATRVGGGGTALTDTDTFDGYTIGQVVKALRNLGFLA